MLLFITYNFSSNATELVPVCWSRRIFCPWPPSLRPAAHIRCSFDQITCRVVERSKKSGGGSGTMEILAGQIRIRAFLSSGLRYRRNLHTAIQFLSWSLIDQIFWNKSVIIWNMLTLFLYKYRRKYFYLGSGYTDQIRPK